MAITQRFENYGGRHPRITFAAGLTAGATAVSGVVLAAAMTVGIGQSVGNSPTSASVLTHEQAYAAEQDYRTARGIMEQVTAAEAASVLPPTGLNEQFRTDLGGVADTESASVLPPAGLNEQLRSELGGVADTESASVLPPAGLNEHLRSELGGVATPAQGVARTQNLSDEQAFAAEQELRSVIGVTGAPAVTGEARVETELRAGMDDSVVGHRFEGSHSVGVETVLTPELAAGMDDTVHGHVPTWMTSELRAGIEG